VANVNLVAAAQAAPNFSLLNEGLVADAKLPEFSDELFSYLFKNFYNRVYTTVKQKDIISNGKENYFLNIFKTQVQAYIKNAQDKGTITSAQNFNIFDPITFDSISIADQEKLNNLESWDIFLYSDSTFVRKSTNVMIWAFEILKDLLLTMEDLVITKSKKVQDPQRAIEIASALLGNDSSVFEEIKDTELPNIEENFAQKFIKNNMYDTESDYILAAEDEIDQKIAVAQQTVKYQDELKRAVLDVKVERLTYYKEIFENRYEGKTVFQIPASAEDPNKQSATEAAGEAFGEALGSEVFTGEEGLDSSSLAFKVNLGILGASTLAQVASAALGGEYITGIQIATAAAVLGVVPSINAITAAMESAELNSDFEAQAHNQTAKAKRDLIKGYRGLTQKRIAAVATEGATANTSVLEMSNLLKAITGVNASLAKSVISRR
jgi:hypothetical protein